MDFFIGYSKKLGKANASFNEMGVLNSTFLANIQKVWRGKASQ
jgi:hypothetical protein